LKDRDEFEDAIENNNITAKQVDSEGFDERTKEEDEIVNNAPTAQDVSLDALGNDITTHDLAANIADNETPDS
jgi:hypothetical protein